jgi:hypothetical protein
MPLDAVVDWVEVGFIPHGACMHMQHHALAMSHDAAVGYRVAAAATAAAAGVLSGLIADCMHKHVSIEATLTVHWDKQSRRGGAQLAAASTFFRRSWQSIQ